MSELINNTEKRKQLLKHMILKLHEGESAEAVREQLQEMLGQVPYGEVVEVEQELISEGLPVEEVLRLCDVHSQALKGVVTETKMSTVPPGHPVHTFIQENRALQLEIAQLESLFRKSKELNAAELLNSFKVHFNRLSDVEKHYRRKENLVFPYLERLGITGPPVVMWGKHDEVRDLLKAVHEALNAPGEITLSDIVSMIEFILKPATAAIEEMIYKEEQILFPMCLERFTDGDWQQIDRESLEIGFCLYDPQVKWHPEGGVEPVEERPIGDRIQLPSGSMTVEELTVMLNTLPVDITFVDRNDKVKYFSQGKHRIFDRNRSILNRDVRMCHPPSSVHVVEQILNDFKSGKESRAPFWIQMGGRFIHIEYFALRNEQGEYLGTLEVSQDLTALRALQGEQRLLSYAKDEA
ncbi:MAG: DUF438 domain-containing protein [candidate division KSB1 bacterium]|nr:DUF438 domain-containing protein [candidate division KSB1 bacterium]